MLEMLISPRHAEQKPSRMFFVGLLYASLSLLLVNWLFLKDPVLSKHSSVLMITFTVIFSMPFIHSLIRVQEIREATEGRGKTLIKPHMQAVAALLFLFLGYLAAFSLLYILLPENILVNNFQSQIEQFCRINFQNLNECLNEYGLSSITGKAVDTTSPFFSILVNNIYVLIFILVFSLTFGAGAIFILAWNASVIAAAIGMLIRASFSQIHVGLLMYLTHGIPEIAAYFVAALAGGILSTAVIRGDFRHGRLMNIISDFTIFMTIALSILFIAALIEVFVTPLLFG
jgi:uncharacterized membrane protein SpoIIM required for sporulation